MAQNRILLSFSKKNTDVFEILEKKKKENIIISDYICECIRYYEKKNSNKESVEDTVKRVIADMLVNGSVPITTVSTVTEEDNKEEVTEEKKYAALEDITNDVVSFINFDDD